MKLHHLSIPFIFLFLIGCSTTYKVTDYPSKEAFQKDFNKSAKDIRVKVTLTDNSLLDVPEGAKIQNDSLLLHFYPGYYPARIRIKKDNYLLSEVKQASYVNHWKGVLPGAGIGLPSGIFLGSVITVAAGLKTGGNHPEGDWFTGAYWGFIIGPVVGAIVGYITGWNYIYQFNP